MSEEEEDIHRHEIEVNVTVKRSIWPWIIFLTVVIVLCGAVSLVMFT